MFIYNDQATAGAGGAIDAAALLAKSGVQTEGEENTVQVPNVTTEQPTASTAAPISEPPKAETKTAETAPVIAEKPIAIQEAAAIAPPDWRSEFKKADRSEVLKELGFDDKMLGFYNTWLKGENIGNYLKAVSVEYDKMTPEQLIRQQLAESYPEFSPEDLEELYQAKVVDHYKLDPETYTEAEVRRGKLLLQADAKSIREQLITRQKDFVLNAKPPELPDYRKEAEEQDRKRQEDQDKLIEQYTNQLSSHNATKQLINDKKLTIGEGEDSFNYEIPEPEKALSVLKNPAIWAQNVFNEDGTPQVEKQLFLAAAALDYKKLATEIFKAGKAVGAKQALEPIENASKQQSSNTTPDPVLTPHQALARLGVLTEG